MCFLIITVMKPIRPPSPQPDNPKVPFLKLHHLLPSPKRSRASTTASSTRGAPGSGAQITTGKLEGIRAAACHQSCRAVRVSLAPRAAVKTG
jgi:hypothetical protein